MIRDKNNNPAENRMNSIYYYYFEESLKERYPDRVTVISGDVTNRESFDKFIDKDINTVINCAANVKHFSKGTDIEDVNLYGTLNVLDFCKKTNARLVHVSTMSVGGMFVGEQGSVDKLKENQLYLVSMRVQNTPCQSSLQKGRFLKRFQRALTQRLCV